MVRKAKRRGLDPSTLPHAEKARIANEIVTFFTDTVPNVIAREYDLLGIAWAENDLFNTLSSLPERELKRQGFTRADIPTLMLSTFHLIRAAKKRKRPARKAARKTARKAAKKKA